MRKIIATILIVVLGFCPVFSYTVLYQDQTNETIHQGLEYLEMRRFTSEGWVDVHVIKADLKDPRLHFVPLYSDSGLGNRATVPAMLEEKDATVGINGDFFYKADQYSPVGITVEDGALLTSPADLSKSFPSILVSQENEISFPIIPWEISIFHPFGVTKAYSVNKTTSEYTVPRIFTGKFTGKTLGNRIPLLEILIEEGVITQIYRNNPSVSIPKEGTLIAVDLVHAPAELNLLRVGDPVTVQNQMESFYEDASTAVGAGAYLLQDGIIPNFALNIEGKHPRSAVGNKL